MFCFTGNRLRRVQIVHGHIPRTWCPTATLSAFISKFRSNSTSRKWRRPGKTIGICHSTKIDIKIYLNFWDHYSVSLYLDIALNNLQKEKLLKMFDVHIVSQYISRAYNTLWCLIAVFDTTCACNLLHDETRNIVIYVRNVHDNVLNFNQRYYKKFILHREVLI